MAAKLPNDTRDLLIAAFRERVISRFRGQWGDSWTPFPHQRDYWLASEGRILLQGQETLPSDPLGVAVTLPDYSVQYWKTQARPEGRARFLSDLGAFKVGKSMGAGLWATGFAAIPDARVNLVGLEYDICAPEFDYICEALLSERGMGLKAASLQNRPRDGKMWLDLENGARYEARSWERKDSLKGKEIDAYIYCEAYQLPGIECFTSFSQNLRARRGYAVFATTPDRPWIKLLHELGHGADSEWHCTCGIDASVNAYTYDERSRERDRSLMTKEKYAIHYAGQLGDFVGRVFQYQRGQVQFSAGSHPQLFRGGSRREHLTVPAGWEIVHGADTGTYYTALTVAFSPTGEAFVLDEYPNYDYVAGTPERDEAVTIPGWARWVVSTTQSLGSANRSSFWADPNSQFKAELRQYGINLLPAKVPVEARTEITREYFQHGRIWLAPWLKILPFELENAQWPEEATAAGKFQRVKDRDHTLDCLEHILARRPSGRILGVKPKTGRWLTSFYRDLPKERGNVHTG